MREFLFRNYVIYCIYRLVYPYMYLFFDNSFHAHPRVWSDRYYGRQMRTTLLMALTTAVMASGAPLGVTAQESDLTKPTVPVVTTVGCVEKAGESWFLTRAADPNETELPFSTFTELEDARGAALGSNRFQLVGVTDFLDAEGLLSSHQRAEFTTPESVNATGQLSEGRKVVVKGLYITSVEPHRINLTSLFSLADTCG